MTPTNVLLAQQAVLLADDTTQLAAAAALKLHLIVAPFTPGPLTDFTTLTEATFPGYAALSAGTGNQQNFTDPTVGRRVVQMKEPAGGWHFQASGAVSPVQIVYGYVLTDNANAITYGGALLAAPITLANSGDGVDIPQVRFAFVPPTLS